MIDEQTSPPATNMKTKKRFNWTVFWAAIAAIAALIAAVFAGLPYFKSSEYQVNAIGRYNTFALPMPVKQDLSNYLELSKNEASINIPLQQHLNEYGAIKSYWSFFVTNRGEKEIRDLKMIVPFSGYYSKVTTGTDVVSSNYREEIQIGNLSPYASATIYVWSDQEPLAEKGAAIRLVHPNGTFPITFSNDIKIPAWKYWIDLISMISTTIMAIAVTLLLFSVLLGKSSLLRLLELTRQQVVKKSDTSDKQEGSPNEEGLNPS